MTKNLKFQLPAEPEILGLSLREEHFPAFQAGIHKFKAFEVIFENYLFTAGERRELIQEFSKNHFVHLHGVTTNLGSLDPLNIKQLQDLSKLSDQVQARILSDHLCFTRLEGKSSFELLPVPRTRKMLRHLGDRLNQVRDLLGQDFLLENIASYFEYDINEMAEIDFLLELHDQYQARFLLDVNNLFVNSKNFGYSAEVFISRLSPDMIGAFHLAGHEDLGSFYFDTHGAAVADPVWQLYKTALKQFGMRPTFLERDENIPAAISELESELLLAQNLLRGLQYET